MTGRRLADSTIGCVRQPKDPRKKSNFKFKSRTAEKWFIDSRNLPCTILAFSSNCLYSNFERVLVRSCGDK